MDPCSMPWVDGLTIGRVLRKTAERFPDQTAIVFPRRQYDITWEIFDHAVDRVAKSLLAIGFQHGDHFGVWAANCPEWLLLQFATARIGVVLVNINPGYQPTELRYAIGQSQIRGLALLDHFKATDCLQMLEQAIPSLPTCQPGQRAHDEFPQLQWLISLTDKTTNGVLSWTEFMQYGNSISNQQLHQREHGLDPHDPINIQYTSGTTALPKGATLSHRNILLNAFYAGANQGLTDTDCLCVPVPLYHCFGCVLASLCAAAYGCAMIYPSETFDAGAVLDAIETYQCTAVYGVPTMFIALLEHPDYPQRRLTSLRTGIMAGSPCPITLMKRVTGEMGAKEMTVGYGETEAAPLLTQTGIYDPLEIRVGTVGRPLPGVEVKIVNPETGEDLGNEQPGEVCGRGHGVMIGYYRDPERTAEAIDGDGWLHTGDLGLREPNGCYRITGRLKDMIIRGGENIYPREIEEYLYRHPAVEEVQIVGVPDLKYGEAVLAWIKLRAGHTVTAKEIQTYCRSGLAHFKTPSHVSFVTSFPTTVTGKIQKFKIREIAINELGLSEVAKIETA
ncbi:AMP-binding protein [Schlesneria paludicola]|uniref:AMP-binding protein n=1 Tax=Schlesneria paludicola TaxID=360056 RepID=UPI0002E40526|nr:AMP-binding protein [Schlesneria paludicola]